MKDSGNVKAVVVLSGGQDSATCLAMACREYGSSSVAAITFSYGQRHSIEVKFAKALAKKSGVRRHKTVKMDFFSSISSSALLDRDSPITRRRGAKCPTSVVEGRNAFFLMAAAVWAKTLGAHEVWTGVSEADFSGYPDCRENFVAAMEKAASLALDFKIKIKTPFMHMSKADEWMLADRLGIVETVKNETVTCYNGIPGGGCGKCPSCRLRAAGYREYMKKKKRTAV